MLSSFARPPRLAHLEKNPKPLNHQPPPNPSQTLPDIYTKPSLAKVQVCSRSVAVSQNGGGAASSGTKTTFQISKLASTACAEAVNDGVKEICSGRDPVATISSMASACASAVAEMQASAISGAEVKANSYPPKEWSKSAYTTACASGCANGQAAAESVARASACAFTAQTKGCNAVKTSLSQQAYSTAFVSATARAWSNACALGYGKAHGEGESAAKALATSLSRAFGDVVAAACSECDTCKCASMPGGLTYDKLKGASDTSAAAANARFTMARALSSASATYCASDRSPRSLKTSVDTTVRTMATVIAEVFASTSGSSSALGTAVSCSGGSVDVAVQASKNALVAAVADASSVVFAQRCASAYAKLDGMVNMLQDALDESYDSISNACATGLAPGQTHVDAKDVVKRQLDSNKPVTAAIGMALQDAASCGCQPGVCIWCKPGKREREATLTYDMGGGVKGVSNGTVAAPKNMQQLLASAARLIS